MLGAAGAAAVLVGGCSSSGSKSPAGGGSTSGSSGGASGAASPTGSPSGSPSGPPTGSGSATTPGTTSSGTTSSGTTSSTSPSGASDGTLRPGASGAEVLALQQRLADLGYWISDQDGKYGDVTVQAVMALQKAAGIGRDGVAGPKTAAALDRGVRPPARSTSGQLLEVDLDRQLLLVVDGGQVRLALNTSTGSGRYYTRPDGTQGHAVTPRGHYSVLRGVDGWDTSPLGHLYRPRYFNGGVAVHGYPSVPPFPASHGCVRVSLPAMDMIWKDGLMPRGREVWVY
jgi:peptidoglycan hydrolase-like protein with peptidoglycan-binding domain